MRTKVRDFDIHRAVRAVESHIRELNLPWLDELAHQHRDPFRVLVSCILSLRTQDSITAQATKRLFQKAPTLEALHGLSVKQIQSLIYPVGFYRTKARRLKEITEILLSQYNGQVPESMDALLKLPGVGRKTANIVLSLGLKRDAIAVDTHVHRITNRWGYVNTKTPEQTEMALRERLPRKYWTRINSLLVAFGQGICKPISPLCTKCRLNDFCPKIGVSYRR